MRRTLPGFHQRLAISYAKRTACRYGEHWSDGLVIRTPVESGPLAQDGRLRSLSRQKPRQERGRHRSPPPHANPGPAEENWLTPHWSCTVRDFLTRPPTSPSERCRFFLLFPLTEGVARLPFTARIERAHSDRARSASKKGTWLCPPTPWLLQKQSHGHLLSLDSGSTEGLDHFPSQYFRHFH